MWPVIILKSDGLDPFWVATFSYGDLYLEKKVKQMKTVRVDRGGLQVHKKLAHSC